MDKLLTKEFIRGLEGLNGRAIKFYLDEAEKRLQDILNTKRELEQKAYVLFAGYITAAFALFGLAERLEDISYWLIGSAFFFCFGVVMLFFVINTSKYGTVGRNPYDWLEDPVYLTVKSNHLAHIYAYVLHDYIADIEISKQSNAYKVFYLRVAVLLGLFSLAPFSIRAIFG
jgi:hypothetical protein